MSEWQQPSILKTECLKGWFEPEKVKIDQIEESTVVTCNYSLPPGRVYLKQRPVHSECFDQLCTMVGQRLPGVPWLIHYPCCGTEQHFKAPISKSDRLKFESQLCLTTLLRANYFTTMSCGFLPLSGNDETSAHKAAGATEEDVYKLAVWSIWLVVNS